MGLVHAGFDVTGVDIKPQPRFPFKFIEADAMRFPLDGYDFIWASPPCQAYIQRNKNLSTRHPRLIEPIRERLIAHSVPYVIENVPGAPLIHPFTLCGSAFGLKVLRHRLFECPFCVVLPPPCQHDGFVATGDYAAVYAFGGRGPRHGKGKRDGPPTQPAPKWADAMGIDWMTDAELSQAVPPAYSEFIGKQVMVALKEKPAFQIEALGKSDRGLLRAALGAARATRKIILMKTASGNLRLDPKLWPEDGIGGVGADEEGN